MVLAQNGIDNLNIQKPFSRKSYTTTQHYAHHYAESLWGEINWSRTVLEELLTLKLPNGAPFPLKPGNVWFEVLSDQSAHQVLDKTWLFNFVIPSDMPVPTKTPKP